MKLYVLAKGIEIIGCASLIGFLLSGRNPLWLTFLLGVIWGGGTAFAGIAERAIDGKDPAETVKNQRDRGLFKKLILAGGSISVLTFCLAFQAHGNISSILAVISTFLMTFILVEYLAYRIGVRKYLIPISDTVPSS